MTSPDVEREVLLRLRDRWPEPEPESPADFWKALAVVLLMIAALYALTIALAGYAPVVPA